MAADVLLPPSFERQQQALREQLAMMQSERDAAGEHVARAPARAAAQVAARALAQRHGARLEVVRARLARARKPIDTNLEP